MPRRADRESNSESILGPARSQREERSWRLRTQKWHAVTCRKRGEREGRSEMARCSERRAMKLTSVMARNAERASLKFLEAGLSREKRTGLRSGSRM